MAERGPKVLLKHVARWLRLERPRDPIQCQPAIKVGLAERLRFKASRRSPFEPKVVCYFKCTRLSPKTVSSLSGHCQWTSTRSVVFRGNDWKVCMN